MQYGIVARLRRTVDDAVTSVDEAARQVERLQARARLGEAGEVIETMRCRSALTAIFVVHFAEGATTYAEVFEAMSEEEWVEVARILGSRKLADVMSWEPPTAPVTDPNRRLSARFSLVRDGWATQQQV